MVKDWLYKKIAEEFHGVDFDILTPPEPELGDYSTNLVFALAKRDKQNPADVAKEVIGKLSADRAVSDFFQKIEFAPPGFINFFFNERFLRDNLGEIIKRGDKYGASNLAKGENINLEFVSANPTGPLTVGNARAASFGDTLGNVFKFAGYSVTKEYYINDVGVQVRILGESVAKRFLELKGEKVIFGENLYQGDYVADIAREIQEKKLASAIENDFEALVDFCRDYAVAGLIKSAKESAEKLGVKFDNWFSEKQLHDSGEVKNILSVLEKAGYVYEKDGAKWLKVSEFEKTDDAVLVKSDGSTSYLMNDIAYTNNKFKRGFDKIINIWGADHHGDVARLKAGARALGFEKDKVEILLHQLVLIKKNDELQRMSKRKGDFMLLDDLLAEVGKDAVRFFFLLKDLNTHMEFDIDLAKEQSRKNPVFYIQYATARLNGVFQKYGGEFEPENFCQHSDLLTSPDELRLLSRLVRLPEIIGEVSKNYQVHSLAQYATDLAHAFHRFYESSHIIQEDKKLENARLCLARGAQITLKNTLALMGIAAPEKM
ncbi:MAG: arginine--tRNA ligase [Candidatus Yanofskybacteria bacterium RIFOXYD1_FULL_42_10]|uniref:Arginine--tRNA ligase n=3 Tax=Parcubacteria group TaxID=1794811 RepID=A0A1F8HV24_9BACT|nr:MAG: Arginine-tRNA ligase [Candidatus Jorgensenbacteria bacterium GW2011_GWF2_41_8]OGN20900.1 MAG: arginine--tRNA ligase [Candidatus Yanofskybacteria bacterium RIFCSPLOWO2_01_FULL_41_33]OGN41427.1 MAG: arginine--tRNA ligase [Candidatus Yanofskybacteria bacterium RIFOXYD1_FULL_42_10]